MGMLGSLIGGAIGTAVAPGIGTELGSKIGGMVGNKKSSGGDSGTNPAGAALGAGQMIAGLIGRKKAMAAVPSVVDPMMQSNLMNIRRRRKMLETGTANAAATAAGRQAIKSLGKQAFTSGGLNTGVLAQLMAQNAENARAAQSDINQMYGLESQTVDTMAQRKFDVNMYKAAQKMAWAEQSKSAGQDNLLAAIGMGGLKGQKEA